MILYVTELIAFSMSDNQKKRMDGAKSHRKPVKKCDAEKMAAIGRHASKVAHELNNQLDGTMRYIDLALRLVEKENLDKPKEYLTHCQKSLTRMAHLLAELLDFSQSNCIPSEYVKIEQLIEDCIKTIEPRADSLNVSISRNYAAELPAVRSGNLFRVFVNLAKNALDAMPDGGELIISTRQVRNDTIAVQFRDTGPGLPEGDPETLFEPFFTTKDKDQGTGLGLAICREIIGNCGGSITAENAPKGGGIFTIYLPATSKTMTSS